MVITELIKDQLLQSAIMFAAGLALGMIYQIHSVLRQELCRKRPARAKKENVPPPALLHFLFPRGKQKENSDQHPPKIKKQKKSTAAGGRKTKNTSSRKHAISFRRGLAAVLEIGFWIFGAFVISEFLYYAAYGEISFHNFLALGLGVLLWKKAFYDIVY